MLLLRDARSGKIEEKGRDSGSTKVQVTLDSVFETTDLKISTSLNLTQFVVKCNLLGRKR